MSMGPADLETADFHPRRVGGTVHVATFVLCGLMAVAVRLLFLQDPVLSDDMGYWGAAERVAAGDWSLLATGSGYHGKRWGMILPVAALIRLFGTTPITYYLLPLAAAFVSGSMAYLIGRRAAGWTEGLLAATFYALIPVSVIANGALLLPDSITSAWMAVAFWSVLRAADRRDAGGQILCGVAAGLYVSAAYACRLTGLYAVPVLVILALWRRRAWALVGVAGGVLAGLAAEGVLFGVLTGDPLHRFHVAGASYYQTWRHHNRVDDLGVLFGRYSTLLGKLKDRLLWWKLSLVAVPVVLMAGRRRQNLISMWFVAMVGMIHLLMRPEGARDYLAAAGAGAAGLLIAVGWVLLEGRRTHRRRWRQPLPWWAGGLGALAVFLAAKQYPIQRALVHQERYFEMAAVPGCVLIAMGLTLVSRRLARLWRPLPLILTALGAAGIVAVIVREPYVAIRVFAEHRRTVLLVCFGGSLAAAGLILLLVRLLSSVRNTNRIALALVLASGFWSLWAVSLLNCEEPILVSGGYARQIGRLATEQRTAGARRIYCHNYMGLIARIFGEGVRHEDLHVVSNETYDDLSDALRRGGPSTALLPDSLVLMDSNEFFIVDDNRRKEAERHGLDPPTTRLDELPAILPANWQLLDVRNLIGKPRILMWRIHPEGRRAATDVPIPASDFADWTRRADGFTLPAGFSTFPPVEAPPWPIQYEKATTDTGRPAVRMILREGTYFWLQTGTAWHQRADENAAPVKPDNFYRLTFRAARPAGKQRVRLSVRIFQFDADGQFVHEIRESFDVWEAWSVRTYPFRTHSDAVAVRMEFSPHRPNTITMGDLRLIHSHAPLERRPQPEGGGR